MKKKFQEGKPYIFKIYYLKMDWCDFQRENIIEGLARIMFFVVLKFEFSISNVMIKTYCCMIYK